MNIRRLQICGAVLVGMGLVGGYSAVAQQERTQGGSQQRGQTGGPSGPQAARGEQQVDRDRDLDRTRDQLHLMDQQQLRDEDIYGAGLMSAAEREQYRQRIQAVETDQEWARARAQHQEQIQARARTQNANLEPPIYGQYMLTVAEQAQYRERLSSAQNEQARIRVREEQQQMIRERARQLGVDAPVPLYGQQLMTEQEQAQLRERLQAATSEQERQRLQAEHREQIQQRAREQQIPLDELDPK